jgi:glycosyltransferase involved in cell wall biosynthesis
MADDRTEVWLYITSLAVGGAERSLVSLANNIDRSRFDVTIWTTFDQNPLADQVDDDVPIRTLGADGVVVGDEQTATVERAKNPVDYVRAPARFVRAVRAERPDIVQSFLVYDNTIARVAGLFAGDTTVVTGARGERNLSDLGLRILDRGLVPLSDYIASNSRAGAEFYVEKGMAPERVTVVYNGRDLDAYSGGSGEGLAAEFGIPADATVVGNVGRLIERKGQYDLLDAWPGIKSAHPDAHCVFVGGGAERDEMRAHAASLDCAESVHFVGTRDDVPALLDLFDVFAFPSHHEGLPGALIEAMAAGLPIVASAIDGNTELVEDGETGLLVPPEDPRALETNVRALLDDPERARSLGRAAQADAYERFSLDTMVEGFEEFYESIA